MAKSKYHLQAKRGNGHFTPSHPEDKRFKEERAKRVRRQRRQGAPTTWLRSRRRVQRQLLG